MEEKKVALEMQFHASFKRENELARVAQRLFEDNMNLVTALSGRAARAAYVAKLSEEKFMHRRMVVFHDTKLDFRKIKHKQFLTN